MSTPKSDALSPPWFPASVSRRGRGGRHQAVVVRVARSRRLGSTPVGVAEATMARAPAELPLGAAGPASGAGSSPTTAVSPGGIASTGAERPEETRRAVPARRPADRQPATGGTSAEAGAPSDTDTAKVQLAAACARSAAPARLTSPRTPKTRRFNIRILGENATAVSAAPGWLPTAKRATSGCARWTNRMGLAAPTVESYPAIALRNLINMGNYPHRQEYLPNLQKIREMGVEEWPSTKRSVGVVPTAACP